LKFLTKAIILTSRTNKYSPPPQGKGSSTVNRHVKSPIELVAQKMRELGANRILFKLLSSNDNSKNQIYLGRSFDVLRVLPHEELKADGITKKGPVFKAPLKLAWLTSLHDPSLTPAPNTQLILYPQYPEVRMSGFLRGSHNAPRHLLQAPTRQERFDREDTPRCLILGICEEGVVIAYLADWESDIRYDAIERINQRDASVVASIFYELAPKIDQNKQVLLNRLKAITQLGAISSRLQSKTGSKNYKAENGAGYTLESLFEITPNGRSEPDFLGWELKCHRNSPVTLMTPEPDKGLYKNDLDKFFELYGRCRPGRRDFNGRYRTGIRSTKSGLTLQMPGYDPIKGKLIDPYGSLELVNDAGEVAAGWSFEKLLSHWAKKHAQTAYIPYSKHKSSIGDDISYKFGPSATLCQGADPLLFLAALYDGTIYYDPGINKKFDPSTLKWSQKKRSQFRTSFRTIEKLYSHCESTII
jgi:hypothetical protein